MRPNRRTLLLVLALATLLIQIPATTAQDQEKELENIAAVLSGVRANAVEGSVAYVREDAKFDL